jgi:hypothetical protein
VSAVPAGERNYFRVRAGAPGAEARMTDAVRPETGQGADAVYAYDAFCRGAAEAVLASNGWTRAAVWDLGGGTRVVKYEQAGGAGER